MPHGQRHQEGVDNKKGGECPFGEGMDFFFKSDPILKGPEYQAEINLSFIIWAKGSTWSSVGRGRAE